MSSSASEQRAGPLADPLTDHPRPASLDGGFFGHPRGLSTLFFTEMWERFSYYGMRAFLILYMVHALGFDDKHAGSVYGTYTASAWAAAIVGGIIADRWLGQYKSVLIGGIIIAAGHFTLAFHPLPFFYAGLALIVYRLVRQRDFSSLVLLLLLALPLLATVAVSAPTGVIEAASVLPAMCIVPAVAIFELASGLGRLPIVLDRMNGVRVFNTPEQIGRLALFVFLIASAIRTFFWYFEASLPAEPGNTYTPSSVGLGIALTLGRAALALAGTLAGTLAAHLPGLLGPLIH